MYKNSRKLGQNEYCMHAYRPTMKKFRRLCYYRIYLLKKTNNKERCNLMGDKRRNTAFLENHIRIKFEGDNPIEVFRFLRNFMDTCNRLDITEIESYGILSFFLTNGAFRLFNPQVDLVELIYLALMTGHPQLTGYSGSTPRTCWLKKLLRNSTRSNKAKKMMIFHTSTVSKNATPDVASTSRLPS